MGQQLSSLQHPPGAPEYMETVPRGPLLQDKPRLQGEYSPKGPWRSRSGLCAALELLKGLGKPKSKEPQGTAQPLQKAGVKP